MQDDLPAPAQLPPSAPREPLHVRQIRCEGFRRGDGLFDVEAHLLDTRPAAADRYGYGNGNGQADRIVHDMWLRLTVGLDFTIRNVEAAMPGTPFDVCPHVLEAFKTLVGVTIGKGWRREVDARVGGVLGCTHLRELLAPMATVCYQTMGVWKKNQGTPASAPASRPHFLDGCKTWATDGEVVARLYPQFSTARQDADAQPSAASDPARRRRPR